MRPFYQSGGSARIIEVHQRQRLQDHGRARRTVRDDGTDEPCPICRGEMSDEFVERMQAAAAQPGRTMTAEEFFAWLDSLDTGSSDPQ